MPPQRSGKLRLGSVIMGGPALRSLIPRLLGMSAGAVDGRGEALVSVIRVLRRRVSQLG